MSSVESSNDVTPTTHHREPGGDILPRYLVATVAIKQPSTLLEKVLEPQPDEGEGQAQRLEAAFAVDGSRLRTVVAQRRAGPPTGRVPTGPPDAHDEGLLVAARADADQLHRCHE